MKIKGSLAVVSGGASGMGSAVCHHLAEQQANIVVIDKNQESAERVAQEVKGLAIGCDVSSGAELEKAFKQIKDKYSQPIAIAVSCAGIAPAKRLVGKNGPVDLEWFQQVININLIGTVNMMRLAAASMMHAQPREDGERGIIINTASIAAYEGQIGQTAYSASKGGVVGLTLPAAREFAQFGIRVMTIAPGIVNTPLMQHMPEEVQASLEKQLIFPKRLGEASEFADLVAHIVTNRMLNGSVIRLDGAMRMEST